ncbi:uncharacterized protein METZ01_LOCUS444505, partial [marine metagenome]
VAEIDKLRYVFIYTEPETGTWRRSFKLLI